LRCAVRSEDLTAHLTHAGKILKKFNFFLDELQKACILIKKYKEKNHEGGLWFPPDSFLAPLYPNQRKPSPFFYTTKIKVVFSVSSFYNYISAFCSKP
jgi:hypothetical protein